MNIRFTTVALLFASLMASGCVHLEKYPDTWDRISVDSVAGRCPSVSGIYENNGAKPDGTKISLAVWLAAATGRSRQEERYVRNRFIDELFKAKIVELELVDDTELSIHAKGDEISIPWAISKNTGQFECKDGAIVIRAGGDMSGDNVAGYSNGSMKLYSSPENLMINWSDSGVGIVLFIPIVYIYSNTWGRFPLRR
jgi:hypothetical protein